MTDSEKNRNFAAISGWTVKGKADTYVQIMSVPSEEQLSPAVAQSYGGHGPCHNGGCLMQAMIQQMGMSETSVQEYVDAMGDED